MKFSNIREYLFTPYNVMGYLSDFSNFDEGLVDVKLHEETILKNEIQDSMARQVGEVAALPNQNK